MTEQKRGDAKCVNSSHGQHDPGEDIRSGFAVCRYCDKPILVERDAWALAEDDDEAA